MGFSVSGAAAIIFASLFIAFGVWFTATANSYDRVAEAQELRTDGTIESGNTAVEIVSATYNESGNQQLAVAVNNTGAAGLSLNATDLLVDGAFVDGWQPGAAVDGNAGISPVGLADLVPVFGSDLPLPLYAVIPITPLLLPGIVLRRAEQRVIGRDQEYPSFVRALGTTESVKQSTSSDVLRTLRGKDFGPLTPNIDDLYKRLNMRIEPVEAWRYFTADCRSYLIQAFSEMYMMGREMGGDPQVLGELIAENMNEVLQLRQQRRQATTTLIGLLYGITAASTFAFFIGLEVVNLLSNFDIDLQADAGFDAGQLINTAQYNIPLIEFLLVVVIMFSAMLSALMIRTVDGGHKVNTYIHFVLMAWISAIVAIITKWLINVFLAI